MQSTSDTKHLCVNCRKYTLILFTILLLELSLLNVQNFTTPYSPPPPPQCPPRTIRRLLDKNLTFHKAIAWMLVASSAVHVIAHWYNYERLVGLVDLRTLRTRWPWELRFVPQLAQPELEFISVSWLYSTTHCTL